MRRSRMNVAPYGTWQSPISAALVASGRTPLDLPWVDGETLYWLEGRPLEGGRSVLVARHPSGAEEVLTPPGFNVRTRVHEYGGGQYTVHRERAYFSNDADQRLYRQDKGGEPIAITPAPPAPAAWRYADGRVSADGCWLVCVRESHQEGAEPSNEIVVVATDGSREPRTIIAGHDFFAFPRISRDGRRLTWTCWDHPRMPWDGTEVWVGDFSSSGELSAARRVAGGAEESIFQPEWSPDGTLHFVSDRSGWWNLYRLQGEEPLALAPMEAEFGLPQWVFGLSTYTFLPDGRIACLYGQHGIERLGILDPSTGQLQPLEVPFTAFSGHLRAVGADRLLCIGASATEAASVVLLEVASGRWQVLKGSLPPAARIEPACVSPAQPLEFPTEDGLTAYALYYPPRNSNCAPLPGERPPLIVLSHGGPTAAASSSFSLATQFWTSRGFAVVDVNYGGSTGYGRAYRQRLNGQWGIVDMQDCASAARALVERGLVDGQRLAIKGGSAGGYTTLCALTFTDLFAAGASYYGVADLETLATDTHKFESRYLDSLVGPYPRERARYRARSPIHALDRLSCPLIIFQGLEDRVVPPSQAEAIVAALRAKGLPFAYLPFEGEQHGFRRAETIQRALEAERSFYGQVFGFQPADELEPVRIENL